MPQAIDASDWALHHTDASPILPRIRERLRCRLNAVVATNCPLNRSRVAVSLLNSPHHCKILPSIADAALVCTVAQPKASGWGLVEQGRLYSGNPLSRGPSRIKVYGLLLSFTSVSLRVERPKRDSSPLPLEAEAIEQVVLSLPILLDLDVEIEKYPRPEEPFKV